MAKKIEPPAKSAPKPDWVAHAIDQGVPSYEAWAMTKPELVKHLTGEDVPDDEESGEANQPPEEPPVSRTTKSKPAKES